MKTWQTEHIFDHPFSTTARAVWRKYPNPLKPEVTGSDVTERSVKDDGSLETHRVMETNFGLPGWSRQLLGTSTVCYGYEKSRLDASKQFMSQVSRNITFAHRVTLGEKLTYTAHGDNQTKLIQESTVEVHGIPFCGYLEDTILSSITKNTFKGRDALEWVVNKINEEEVLGIEPDHNNGLGPKLFTKLDEINTDKEIFVPIENLPNAQVALAVLDDITESVDKLGEKASKSIDDLGEKASKSIDDISEKALKSIKSMDDLNKKALKSIKSMDNLSEKALKSMDDLSEKALKPIKFIDNLNVDLIGDKAMQSIKTMDDNLSEAVEDISSMAFKFVGGTASIISDTWSPHALRSYEIFDDFFNLS